ncbi:MAG: hypothetical protein WCF36_07060 [Candidatus Nanopelagicales bacterium]
MIDADTVGLAVARRWVQVGTARVAVDVCELGLACCGVEVREARRIAQSLGAVLPEAASDAEAADLNVLVVAGTVTTALAPALAQAYRNLPEPRAVLAFGACAATGGPYWDSYSVLPGAHEVLPVDVWVPGCPPRPADLVAGLEQVLHARG